MSKSLSHQMLDYARLKRRDERYDYCSNYNCAIAQFLKDRGYPVWGVGGDYWRDTDYNEHSLPRQMGEAALTYPRTWGALADRLADALGVS